MRWKRRNVVKIASIFAAFFLLASISTALSEEQPKQPSDNDETPETVTTTLPSSQTCEADDDRQECKNPEADSDNNESSDQGKSKSEAGVRLVTREELSNHSGRNGSEIWLSILGEVYNVTAGKSYYDYEKGSYGAFAGTDCTLCFVSGTFTQEEADKSSEEIQDSQLAGIFDWRDFYAGHDTYNFIGYLIDPRYYDETGRLTPSMIKLRDRMKVAMEEVAKKRAENEKKRAEMKKKLEEKRKKKAEAQKNKE